jgi:hypothetical protein
MSDGYARSYVKELINKGFICFNDSGTDDLVVVNQLYGFVATCNWAIFKKINYENDPNQSVASCAHVDDMDSVFCAPDQWEYKDSLSHTFMLVPTDQADKSLEFLRHEGSVDVYFNKLTGEEVFHGVVK